MNDDRTRLILSVVGVIMLICIIAIPVIMIYKRLNLSEEDLRERKRKKYTGYILKYAYKLDILHPLRQLAIRDINSILDMPYEEARKIYKKIWFKSISIEVKLLWSGAGLLLLIRVIRLLSQQ